MKCSILDIHKRRRAKFFKSGLLNYTTKFQMKNFRFITQQGNRLETVRPPMAVTNAVSWRSEGIKYRKNEVFLDVIESVNMLVSF